MAKIIKRNSNDDHISSPESEYFSRVKEGEQPFQYVNFTTEMSVQDEAVKSMIEGNRTRKVIKPIAGYDEDDTNPEAGNAFREVSMEELAVNADEVSVPESQKDKLKENAKERELEEQLQCTNKQVADLNGEIARLNAQLQEFQDALPAQLEASKQEGYEQGKAYQLAEGERKYEAEKNDYMNSVNQSWQVAIGEIGKLHDTLKAFDEQIPGIVVSFVREIIGAERKLNDGLILNIVKSTMDRLGDLQNLSFTVNPADMEALQSGMPGIEVKGDAGMPKGNVKMHTKAGEVDISIDSWLDGLEKQIHEQFAATQNN